MQIRNRPESTNPPFPLSPTPQQLPLPKKKGFFVNEEALFLENSARSGGSSTLILYKRIIFLQVVIGIEFGGIWER